MIATATTVAAALLATAASALAATVTATLQATPASYTGACPATITFNGTITGPAGATVAYAFDRHYQAIGSQAIIGPTHTGTIPAGGSLQVSETLSIDAAHAGNNVDQIWVMHPLGGADVYSPFASYSVNCKTTTPVGPGNVILVAPPTVTAHTYGDLEPGLQYELIGFGFGANPGEVRLAISKYGQYSSNPYVDLIIDKWTDAKVDAHVPADLSGYVDQTTSVYLVRGSDHAQTDPMRLDYNAPRERRRLQPSDFNTNCDHSSQQDICEAFLTAQQSKNASFAAYHASLCCFNAATGTDEYRLKPLRNGWVVSDYTYDLCDNESGGVKSNFVRSDYSSSFEPGHPYLDLKMSWYTAGPTGKSCYYGYVYAVGPRGTPIR